MGLIILTYIIISHTDEIPAPAADASTAAASRALQLCMLSLINAEAAPLDSRSWRVQSLFSALHCNNSAGIPVYSTF